VVAVCDGIADRLQICDRPSIRYREAVIRAGKVFDLFNLLKLTLFRQPRLLLRDPLQQFRSWFVVAILRHQLAAHGKVEDGLAELLDLVGARGDGGQHAQREARVVEECFRIGRVEAGKARRRQPVAHRLAGSPRRLQPIAQGHQFIDLGDDAVLFAEGWDRNQEVGIVCPFNPVSPVA
jgi:hypothetical protein